MLYKKKEKLNDVSIRLKQISYLNLYNLKATCENLIYCFYSGSDLKVWRPWSNEEVETPNHF